MPGSQVCAWLSKCLALPWARVLTGCPHANCWCGSALAHYLGVLSCSQVPALTIVYLAATTDPDVKGEELKRRAHTQQQMADGTIVMLLSHDCTSLHTLCRSLEHVDISVQPGHATVARGMQRIMMPFGPGCSVKAVISSASTAAAPPDCRPDMPPLPSSARGRCMDGTPRLAAINASNDGPTSSIGA